MESFTQIHHCDGQIPRNHPVSLWVTVVYLSYRFHSMWFPLRLNVKFQENKSVLNFVKLNRGRHNRQPEFPAWLWRWQHSHLWVERVDINWQYSLSNVIMADDKLASFPQYLRYSHKHSTIVFSTPSTIIWAYSHVSSTISHRIHWITCSNKLNCAETMLYYQQYLKHFVDQMTQLTGEGSRLDRINKKSNINRWLSQLEKEAG